MRRGDKRKSCYFKKSEKVIKAGINIEPSTENTQYLTELKRVFDDITIS